MGSLQIRAAVVDEQLLQHIEEGAEIAPLHNRPALRALREAQQALPDVPHVAVSDSYFHRTLSEAAKEYAIPRDLRERYGIVRHGFHGLSVEWAASLVRVPRLVVCHLGGGCSVTGLRDGRSVDTTMGWTPLEGLPGATRSGSVDPGALLYLMRRQGVDELDRRLEEEAGLAALGGLDGERGFGVFVHRVAQSAAGMAAAAGGLDALVFTAGVGENRPDIRAAVAERLRFLGVELDGGRNRDAVPDCVVSSDASAVRVHVVRAREELVAARAARAVLSSDGES
jgi:acetate kinase